MQSSQPDQPVDSHSSRTLPQVLSAIEATAFTATIVVLHLILVLWVPQTEDVVMQHSRLFSDFSLQSFFTILSLAWFSLICWWTSSHVLAQVEAVRPGLQTHPRLTNLIPRIYAGLPILWLVLSDLQSGLSEITIACVIVLVAVFWFTAPSRNWHKSAWLTKTHLNSETMWLMVILLVTGMLISSSVFAVFETAETLQGFATLHFGLAVLLVTLTLGVYLVCRALCSLIRFLSKSLGAIDPRLGKIGAIEFLFVPPLPILTMSILYAIFISYMVESDNHGVRRCLVNPPAGYETFQCPGVEVSGKAKSYHYAFGSLSQAWEKFTHQLDESDLTTAVDQNLTTGNSTSGFGDETANNNGRESPAGKPELPVFFVTSQGGGLRASYWSGLVLAELERRHPGFHRHVFTVAGVSGGAVGNTFYVAQLAQQHQAKADPQKITETLSHKIGRDYLSPVVTSFLNNDLMFRFMPIWLNPYQQDRASVLEQSWERGFACNETGEYCRYDSYPEWSGMEQPLQQVYRPYAGNNNQDWLPLLFNLGTVQEWGLPVITAPLPIRQTDFPGKYDLYELMQCHDNGNLSCDVRLSTSALNAARFPYVTPAGSLNYNYETGLTHIAGLNHDTDCDCDQQKALPYKKKLHIIDGGYFDNIGASTILQLIRTLQQQSAFETSKYKLIPVVLILTNDPTMDKTIIKTDGSLPQNYSSWMANELSAPAQGIIGVWGGHTNAALKDLLHELPLKSEPALTARSFVLQIPSGNGYDQLPLGWWLSEEAKDAMHKLVCPEQAHLPSDTIDNILKLLTKHVSSLQEHSQALIAKASPPWGFCQLR